MADQLATPSDLAALLQCDLDLSSATLAIEMATAIVQEAAGGQRIIQVVDDVVTLAGTSDTWLDLPQIPVTAVSAVSRDDDVTVTLGTDPRVVGNRIWASGGWLGNLGWGYVATSPGGAVIPSGSGPTPSLITVTYTHGYAPGSQDLQLARSATLAIAKAGYANPAGVTSERIDDYSVSYDAMASRLEAAPHLRAALARKYGRRAGLARIG